MGEKEHAFWRQKKLLCEHKLNCRHPVKLIWLYLEMFTKLQGKILKYDHFPWNPFVNKALWNIYCGSYQFLKIPSGNSRCHGNLSTHHIVLIRTFSMRSSSFSNCPTLSGLRSSFGSLCWVWLSVAEKTCQAQVKRNGSISLPEGTGPKHVSDISCIYSCIGCSFKSCFSG